MKGDGDKRLLFYNHYDVQPPEPVEAWQYEPFGAQIDGGRLYGRGTADNKGPLYSRIHALEAWLKTQGGLPVSVAFWWMEKRRVGVRTSSSALKRTAVNSPPDLCIWKNAYRDIHGRPEVRPGQ